MLRKAFKILGIFILTILIAAIVTPFFFKSTLQKEAKKEINNMVNARVDFNDFGLNLFSNFPDFTATLSGLTVVGKDNFEKDTLTSIPDFSITIDLFSVLFGDEYKIKQIALYKPTINAIILENGIANWDIMLDEDNADTENSKENETKTSEQAESPFKMALNQFTIQDAVINYNDYETDMFVQNKNFDFNLSGNFNDLKTKLKTELSIQDFYFNYEGIAYFNHIPLFFEAGIDADLENYIFTFIDNVFKINDVKMALSGNFEMPDDTYKMDINFTLQETTFKDILSLVPAFYKNDFEDINAEGKIDFSGMIKGLYAENMFPEFDFMLNIDDAEIKYADLPKKIEQIVLHTRLYNKTNNFDNTVLEIEKLYALFDKNPIDARFVITNPETNPAIDTRIKTKLNLSTIKDFVPFEENENLQGIIVSDIDIKANMQDIENEQYEKTSIKGQFIINDLLYQSADLPEPLEISNLYLNLYPQKTELTQCALKIGKNDINASGIIQNLPAYIMNDDKLSGNFTIKSNYLNLDDFLAEDTTATETNLPETTEENTTNNSENIMLPENISFTLTANCNKMVYNNIEMNNVKSELKLKNKKAILSFLQLQMAKGTAIIKGDFSTPNRQTTTFSTNVEIMDFDFNESYKTLQIIEKLAPIAKQCSGTYSSELSIKGFLDKDLYPIIETIWAKGRMQTHNLKVKQIKPMQELIDKYQIKKLNTAQIEDVNISFMVDDGKITVEPFEIKIPDAHGTVYGSHSLENKMDYTMDMAVSSSIVNKSVSAITTLLGGKGVKLPEELPFKITATGDINNPEIKVMPGGKGNSTNSKTDIQENINDAKETIEETIDDAKNEAVREAKKQAQKLIAEANKQAAKIEQAGKNQANTIRQNGKQAADIIRNEGNKQADDMVKKANNPLAKKAAQKAAEEIKQKAEKNAQNTEKEANKKASAVEQEAKNKANKIRKEAREKGNKLIKEAQSK